MGEYNNVWKLIIGEYELLVAMDYGWIWNVCEHKLRVNMKNGWIWFFGE